MSIKRDENGRPVGLDWGSISQPADPEVWRRPLPKPKRVRKPTGRPRGGIPQAKCRNGHDMEEWGKQTYRKDGRKNGRYCTFPGCNNGKSKQFEKEGKVYVPGIKGAPPGEYCPAGLHLMSEHGVQKYKKSGAKDGRYCRECKRLYRNVSSD